MCVLAAGALLTSCRYDVEGNGWTIAASHRRPAADQRTKHGMFVSIEKVETY